MAGDGQPPHPASASEAAPEALAGEGPAPVIERKFIGLVGVDSGTMVLGDPTYLLPFKERTKAGIDYQEVIDAPIAPVQDLGGRPVLLFQDFGGEGSFAVFGEFEDGELMSFTVHLNPVDIDALEAALKGSDGGD
jgi:hypothetical protein